MRRRRTIYFNDARHYYLFVYDPPMRMEDAWVPVDEVAGTAVDTFSYGVSRGDGLFYPTKVGLEWGSDRKPFQSAYEWRCWENMQSLIAKDLDPELQALLGYTQGNYALGYFSDPENQFANYDLLPPEMALGRTPKKGSSLSEAVEDERELKESGQL